MKFSVPTFVIIVFVLNSCQGEKTSAMPNVSIPDLSIIKSPYKMGEGNYDIPFLHTKRKTVSVHAFYMDQNEITSNDTNSYACPGVEFPEE
jgi:hypothetical protein